MKKLAFVFLLFSALAFQARRDSLKFSNFRGFYINSHYPYRLYNSYINHDKYSAEYYYKFELKPYSFQMPGIGIGYVINKNGWFIKTDLNYWYAYKHLDDNFYFNADDKNSRNTYSSFTSFSSPSVGTRYYNIHDHIKGSLNLHYFDVGIAINGEYYQIS